MSESERHLLTSPQGKFYCQFAPQGASILANDQEQVLSVDCSNLMPIQDMCRVRLLPYTCLFPRCPLLHPIPDTFRDIS